MSREGGFHGDPSKEMREEPKYELTLDRNMEDEKLIMDGTIGDKKIHIVLDETGTGCGGYGDVESATIDGVEISEEEAEKLWKKYINKCK